MRLLTALPGSVLWLKQAGDKAKANLQQAARDAGVDERRLVFAKPAPLDVHLARHRLRTCSWTPRPMAPTPPPATRCLPACRC